jgi:hypothetical protein
MVPNGRYDLPSESETEAWEDRMRARSGSLSTAARKSWRSSVLTAAVAAGLLFFGSAAWAQSEETSEPPQALRVLKIIPINGTAASPNTHMFSFDISWVDQATGLYYLADRSNKALDVIDTTGTFTGTPETLFGQIGGPAPNGAGFAGDTGTAATSGPNGVVAASGCIFATDTASTGGGRVVSFNSAVSFVAPVSSVSTGGNRRADELAFDPKDRLLLVINNAEVPPSVPFGSLISVDSNCGLKVGVQFNFNSIGATNGAEQPQWDPGTQKFYISIPEINGPGGGGPHGGVARISTSGVIETVYPINFCGPGGLTIGPNGDLLVGCNSVFTTSGNACTTVNAAATGTNAAALQSLGAIVPPVCNGIAAPQSVICNITPGRDCTGNALVSVPGNGGGDEVWFNKGDGNYYVTGGNNPGGPVFSVVASGVDTLSQLVPTLYAQLQQGISNTSSFVHSSGSVHSIAASDANNHVYVALPANIAYPNCVQGCVAVFGVQ